MPTITVPRAVTLDEATEALQRELGSAYTLTPHPGARETIGVRHGAALAGIRVIHDADTTSFRVHGRGLLISYPINELGIARKVSHALTDALGSTVS